MDFWEIKPNISPERILLTSFLTQMDFRTQVSVYLDTLLQEQIPPIKPTEQNIRLIMAEKLRY